MSQTPTVADATASDLTFPTLALAWADAAITEGLRDFREAVADADSSEAVWVIRKRAFAFEKAFMELDAACREKATQFQE